MMESEKFFEDKNSFHAMTKMPFLLMSKGVAFLKQNKKTTELTRWKCMKLSNQHSSQIYPPRKKKKVTVASLGHI